MTKIFDAVEYYAEPFGYTKGGLHHDALAGLPGERDALAKVIHQLLIHESWASRYGVVPDSSQLHGPHLRAVAAMVDEILRLSPASLDVGREPALRALCCCRHFTVLAVAAFRAKGIPARARCGFGMYFKRGKGVDHWIAEVFEAGRWVRADFQIDALQRRVLRLQFDPLDQRPGKFLTAGEAWTLCRSGGARPEDFGIAHEGGLWFIAMNLARDIAALRRREMLPWDDWGGLIDSDALLTPDYLERFDDLARMTRSPDQSFFELANAYEVQPGLAVPRTVFNAVRQTSDAVNTDY